MPTVVISGRVDANVARRADQYIRLTGSSATQVIKTVWGRIATTGEVPTAEDKDESAAEDRWEAFMQLREELAKSAIEPALYSDDEIKEMRMKRYE